MKKKILGILVMTLLIAATVLPVAGTVDVDSDNENIKESVEKNVVSNNSPNSGNRKLPRPLSVCWYQSWFPDEDWRYCNGPSPDMYAIPTGNVGIGTTNPAQKLHIKKDYDGTTGLLIENTDNSINSRPKLALKSNGNKDGRIEFIDDVGTAGGIWYFHSVDRMDLITGYSAGPGISIDSQQNVGIGTISPTTKLHVNGPVATAITTVATDYDITSSDSVILGNGVDIHVKLPKADTCQGREYTIKKINADSFGAVSVDCHYTSPSEFDLLDNHVNTHAPNTRNDYIVVVSDGVSNWLVTGMGPGLG